MQLIDGPSVWTRRDVRPEEYRIDLSAACLDEIRRAADEIRAYPLPTILRAPGDFAMPICRREMARVREMLDHGRRFAIVDRLPMAQIDAAGATGIYWLLFRMGSRPVAPKLYRPVIFDGRRRRRQPAPGPGVDTCCGVSRSIETARPRWRQCSTSSRKTASRSISTSSQGRSSLSTTGRWATAVLPSSMTRTPSAGATLYACGCATAGAVPTRANIDIGAALVEAEGLYRERNPKSLAQHREACAAMPGGNTRSAIDVDPCPVTIAPGAGAPLWDLAGHAYF